MTNHKNNRISPGTVPTPSLPPPPPPGLGGPGLGVTHPPTSPLLPLPPPPGSGVRVRSSTLSSPVCTFCIPSNPPPLNSTNGLRFSHGPPTDPPSGTDPLRGGAVTPPYQCTLKRRPPAVLRVIAFRPRPPREVPLLLFLFCNRMSPDRVPSHPPQLPSPPSCARTERRRGGVEGGHMSHFAHSLVIFYRLRTHRGYAWGRHMSQCRCSHKGATGGGGGVVGVTVSRISPLAGT